MARLEKSASKAQQTTRGRSFSITLASQQQACLSVVPGRRPPWPSENPRDKMPPVIPRTVRVHPQFKRGPNSDTIRGGARRVTRVAQKQDNALPYRMAGGVGTLPSIFACLPRNMDLALIGRAGGRAPNGIRVIPAIAAGRRGAPGRDAARKSPSLWCPRRLSMGTGTPQSRWHMGSAQFSSSWSAWRLAQFTGFPAGMK